MIKLSVPDVGEDELRELKKVLDSKWLVQGEKVDEFENLVKNYLGIKNVIAVSSGTAALHLALLAIGIMPGDEVIVPDFTFPATANVVEIVGATPRFVDIDINSFNIDVNKIEREINDKTKAIIPVHEFGCPAEMDKIIELAKKYNLRVIEDAACALGSEYKDKKVGTIGDIGCFSLHPRKNITTGEGGLVVTNNDEFAKKVKILRNHGINIENGKIEFILPGFNYRMTNLQGALGVIQIKKIDKIYEERKKIVDEYNRLLKDLDLIRLPNEAIVGKHIWQTYHILLDNRMDRNRLLKYLRENDIECNYGAYAVHNEPYYKNKYKYNDDDFYNSIYAATKGVALPLHSKLGMKVVKYLVDKIKSFCNDNG
ncbi:UDP-4-amino-4-deoxy-L-arabinose--oxoglutarate aminotransferase [Caloramator mitchellensis]|uniref:UDP-4-amino-4-deoxy-L-arabinose--oxoglutarate aminotransferase n=1 Tax=Caloramator mitchellensis TaxID=908809 RepID=A0A0R3JX64_CALMK|nr:DegT/DnrJ/EryC1/StrS family aminotransferase [Caloramator mitchellensis]KRQ85774.1 UDP-4-amino-4-deoxy-L-arabinose--oxoglutarate aminotransferase [Caloramator mitchellensis]